MNDVAPYSTAMPRGQVGHFGKYRARVTDNRDPQNLGRLQVLAPAVLYDTEVWALPCVPYAGPDVGWFAMPPVGAAVWVEFEGGDLDHPIWTGCYWPNDQTPPEGGSDPDIKVLKTEKVTIRIDDRSGEIEITTQGGSRLKLTATDGELKSTTVTCESVNGKGVFSAAGLDVNDGAFTVI